MELLIERTYYKKGTNGVLYVDGVAFCFTIELPWKGNQQCISCIPEGRYPVVKRSSKRFPSHLWVQDVPERELILFHPGNIAWKDLKGCIAPVTELAGQGIGDDSVPAFKALVGLVEALPEEEEVWLTIPPASTSQEPTPFGIPLIISLQNVHTCKQQMAA
jgi:hypothetical protein